MDPIPGPSPAPQPTPQPGQAWMTVLLLVGLVLALSNPNGCQPTPPVPPTPPAPPAPIPLAGLRVLVIYESAPEAMEQLPQTQKLILTSQDVRDQLNQLCATDADGSHAYRFLDPDTEFAAASYWKTALARARSALPWVIVSNGKTGFEGQLPPTIEEFVALVNKYKGP